MKRLEQSRLRVGQGLQRALHHRPSIAPLLPALFIHEGIGITVADPFDRFMPPMIAEQSGRDTREPRGWTFWNTAPLPVIDGAQPRLLGDVFGQLPIATATSNDELEQIVDRCSIRGADIVFR